MNSQDPKGPFGLPASESFDGDSRSRREPSLTPPPSTSGSAAEPRAGEDAPATNRASERYKEEPLRVLWQGIDTLELSYKGEPHPGLIEELERLKALAQSSDPMEQAAAWFIRDGWLLQVRDRGSGLFAFQLQDARLSVRVRGRKGKSLPLAFVRVRSEYLFQEGPHRALAVARQIVDALGVVEGEPSCSRIDITADFTSDVRMDGWSRSEWITRAENRAAHSCGDAFSGWSIGLRGPTLFRLYDKVLEIKTQSNKVYLYDAWHERGWLPGDPAWRAEFQLRRPTLSQFSLTTPNEVLSGLPSLWRYLTHEWLRLALPNEGDVNRARWETHPLWIALQSVTWNGSDGDLRRRRVQSNSPRDAWLARGCIAVLTSLMAKEGVRDLDEAFRSLRTKVEAELQRRELYEGAPGEQLLLESALRKERKYGTFLLAESLGLLQSQVSCRHPGEEG